MSTRAVVSLAPGCAAGAREAVRRHLTWWRLEDLGDDATLIVSELLSNAVRHGRPPWRVRMWLKGGESGRRGVRLEVHDGGTGVDIERIRARWRHPSGALLGGGRGLFIVDTLARAWGNERSGHGHTVWAELESSHTAAEPGPDGA